MKHTARDHHDRLPLQLALTELETLTHRLNESKRESEDQSEAKHFVHCLIGRHSLKTEADRYLVRRENLYQLVCILLSNNIPSMGFTNRGLTFSLLLTISMKVSTTDILLIIDREAR